MNRNTKIRFISWFAAVSLIAGGYTLIKNDYEKTNIITTVTNSEDDNSNKCELNIINNVIEEVNVKIIDSNDCVVDSWIQNEKPHYINDLDQGLYTIECQSKSFNFIESNIAINYDMSTEIRICNGYLMLGYHNDQDDTVNYSSNTVLTKKK